MSERHQNDVRSALPLLPSMHYRTIYADPPWLEVGGGVIKRGANAHYGLMKQAELMALSGHVRRITAAAAHLYLWVTNNFMEEGLELARAWGFEYKTLITWAKDRFGLGQYFRGQTEHCIFAAKNVLPYKVKDGKRQQGTTLIIAPRLEHSEKPAQMREYIERVSYEPRLELFGRNVPAEWDAIGLELESCETKRKCHVTRHLLFQPRSFHAPDAANKRAKG